MNMNYNYLTTIFRSIFTQIYAFLVLFTIFHFDLEKFISENCKYIFWGGEGGGGMFDPCFGIQYLISILVLQ